MSKVTNNLPMKPGYYWAQWRVPAEGTHEGELQCPSTTWIIVEVWANIVDWRDNPLAGEALAVSVHGVRETQWPDCFLRKANANH